MLVGLVVIAVISGAYLGWQNFARSPSSTPGPPAPVPVIATTVQPRDFPIVLTGIGNITALNSATVRSMVTEVRDNGLALPLDAVQQGPQGQYVFVVGPDHKVAMQPVSVRESLNGEALINKGLSAGETVVVRGQYRLTPGTVVSLADPNNPTAVPIPTTASAGLLP